MSPRAGPQQPLTQGSGWGAGEGQHEERAVEEAGLGLPVAGNPGCRTLHVSRPMADTPETPWVGPRPFRVSFMECPGFGSDRLTGFLACFSGRGPLELPHAPGVFGEN